jgi:hypothetical protein
MSEENKTTTTTKKPSVLDFASTGSDVDMEAADVDGIKHTIKVNISMKPSLNLGYVRSHPECCALYATAISRPGDSTIKDTYFLQLQKEEQDELEKWTSLKKVHFTPLILPYGESGFWQRSVPYGNKRVSPTQSSGKTIWEIAQKKWIKPYFNQQSWSYEYFEPMDYEIFPTDDELVDMWPTQSFAELISKGLDQNGLVIRDLEDIRVKRIMGSAR